MGEDRAMRFGSVCSGIGAPECAWASLGWRIAFVDSIAEREAA